VDAVITWHYPVAADGYGWAPTGLAGGFDFKENAEKAIADAIGTACTPGSGVTVRARVVQGNPAQVLLDASDDADLLVVGSRRHGGFTEALLGAARPERRREDNLDPGADDTSQGRLRPCPGSGPGRPEGRQGPSGR
jgi:hypothetical protein